MIKKYGVLILVLVSVGINLFARNSNWVDEWYAHSVYLKIAHFFRYLLGWVPFSVGDVLYFLAIVLIIYVVFQLLKKIFKREITKKSLLIAAKKSLIVLCIVYISFQLLWGLNYARSGVSKDFGLEVIDSVNKNDLDTLVNALHLKLNENARLVYNTDKAAIQSKDSVFNTAIAAYHKAAQKYDWLKYETKSIKPTFYGYILNYFGFLGYYNPFTGEAQVNITGPKFAHPFIAVHEMGHQVGYARENEANFVGFLAGRESDNANLRYSIYLDMYRYAVNDLWMLDSIKAKNYQYTLHRQVKADLLENYNFYKDKQSVFEPAIKWIYSKFLIINNQPSGLYSYNEVVGWLIAYYKKNNITAI